MDKEKKERVPDFKEIREDFIEKFEKLDQIFSKIECFEPVESFKFGELSKRSISIWQPLNLKHIKQNVLTNCTLKWNRTC